MRKLFDLWAPWPYIVRHYHMRADKAPRLYDASAANRCVAHDGHVVFQDYSVPDDRKADNIAISADDGTLADPAECIYGSASSDVV